MKPLPALRLASVLLAAMGTLGVAQAQTRPYVETTSLTFLWNLVDTGISSTTAPAGSSPGTNLDPKSYDPTEPITIETASLISYPEGSGDHEAVMRLIIQALTRNRGFNLNKDYYIQDVDHNRDGVIADTDTDGNGVLENMDRNGDGLIANVDYNRDRIIANTDINGDGVIANTDVNDDGIIQNVDLNADRVIKDTDRNGNGVIKDEDINGDGEIKDVDTDKNGKIDPAEMEREIEVEGEIEVEAELEVETVRPGLLGKPTAPYNWQLVAVREVPRTVQEMATNPYTIYVTLIDRTAVGLPYVLTKADEYSQEEVPDLFGFPQYINTGITFTLGEWAASGTVQEKYTGPYVTNAKGKVTTAFEIKFGALFYDDPRYLAANNAEPHQYHLKRHIWNIFSSGHIIYNIRSIPGPVGTNLDGTFFATNVDMTGVGWFEHEFIEGVGKEDPENFYFISEIKDNSFFYNGLAPLRVKMGNIQYQNRNMFPGFGTTPPPAP